MNQFRTLKNSGDAEVLAVWKEIAPPGTQRVHFSGCQWSEYYQNDSAGNRVSTQNGWGMYDAFGKPFGDELETDERGYNGKPYDAVLGHYNYGFRDYDPMTGRFATVDPVRDGRNWYVYTANDPVNYIDAWGLAAEDSIKEEYLSGIDLRYDRDDKTFKWISNGTGQSTPIDDAFAGAIPGFDPPKDRNFFPEKCTNDYAVSGEGKTKSQRGGLCSLHWSI